MSQPEAPLFNEQQYIQALVDGFDPDRFKSLAENDRTGFLGTVTDIVDFAKQEGVFILPQAQVRIQALAEKAFLNLISGAQKPDLIPIFLLIDQIGTTLPFPNEFPEDQVPISIRAASQTITTCQLFLLDALSKTQSDGQ